MYKISLLTKVSAFPRKKNKESGFYGKKLYLFVRN